MDGNCSQLEGDVRINAIREVFVNVGSVKVLVLDLVRQVLQHFEDYHASVTPFSPAHSNEFDKCGYEVPTCIGSCMRCSLTPRRQLETGQHKVG